MWALTSWERFKPQDGIAQDGDMSLVLLCLGFPLCKREAGLCLCQYRKYNLDVWMTLSSISMSYGSLHHTLIINSHALTIHSKAKPCQGTGDQPLTAAGNFREGTSFGGNRRIILFLWMLHQVRGTERGWTLVSQMKGRGDYMHKAAESQESADRAGGTRRMKLFCEDLGRAQLHLWAGFGEEASHTFTKNLPIPN